MNCLLPQVYDSNITMLGLRSSGPSLLHMSSNINRLFPRSPMLIKKCRLITRSWSSSANLKDHATSNVLRPIDICNGGTQFIADSFFEKTKDFEQSSKLCDDASVLRAGMVLLKNYITLDEQVAIVRECRRLGLGPGGFYKVNMCRMLMCLGLDWDPKTSRYNKTRRFDNTPVPSIPREFLGLVNDSIMAARACTEKRYGPKIVESIVPMMSPDVCLLNFYTTAGRLGLHQDKDESKLSLEKRIPIVSFSIGDSGEFYYGDHYDIREAKKVMLESGDVLIFGGPARHIFHGVQSIVPHSAPESLLKETGLRPGRLNLTFRQFSVLTGGDISI